MRHLCLVDICWTCLHVTGIGVLEGPPVVLSVPALEVGGHEGVDLALLDSFDTFCYRSPAQALPG